MAMESGIFRESFPGLITSTMGQPVPAIWLSPIYPSPMGDFGYDVADYCGIDPRFGTLADFDWLAAEAKRRGIRITMNLVSNHTSSAHPWFQQARQSRSAPTRDWYYWADGRGA